MLGAAFDWKGDSAVYVVRVLWKEVKQSEKKRMEQGRKRTVLGDSFLPYPGFVTPP